MRRTKIVATLGPATDSEADLEALICAGANVLRLNFSHGSADEHRRRAELARGLAERHGLPLALLGDLQGPKIRVGRFAEGPITLAQGDAFTIDVNWPFDEGDQQQVGTDYPELADDCAAGDRLLLDDGRIVLQVDEIADGRLHCHVVVGGVLSDKKGINRQGGGLSAPALTDKDRADIETAVDLGLDYLAVSFPRSADDMRLARELMVRAGGRAGLVAKVERAEAVADEETLTELIKASDAVMVARGDLGVEIGDAELIGVQKQIIRLARANNRCVITATQMMETMIQNPLPTRAEVFDVANAVLDGTDAVMLSGETAVGKYPVETVEAMSRVVVGAEKHPSTQTSTHRVAQAFTAVDETIALSAMYAANHLEGIRAIICLSETGNTPRLMSRISSALPIFALCRRADTRARVALYRGVTPLAFDVISVPADLVNRRAVELLLDLGVVEEGDLVIISKGDHLSAQDGTNALKIVRVGQVN